jgi:hypothetical protein
MPSGCLCVRIYDLPAEPERSGRPGRQGKEDGKPASGYTGSRRQVRSIGGREILLTTKFSLESGGLVEEIAGIMAPGIRMER